MDNLLVIIYAALLVEAVVNVVRNISEKETCWKYWVSLALGITVAVLVAVNYDLDFFEALGMSGKIPYVGAVLTGFIISRGANIVSDLVGRLNSYKRGMVKITDLDDYAVG